MEVLLIRHGESEADLLNVHEGRADCSLTEHGNKQAEAMAERVQTEFPPDIIWSSTLKRAMETASYISEQVGCDIHYEDDLMEFNNGIFAGVPFEEAKNLPLPEHPHERIQDGESFIEFRMRIEMIFSKIITSSTHRRIAIVAHGRVLNNIIQTFLKQPITKDYWFKTGDTGIHLVEITERDRVIHFLNDTSHLHNLNA